MKQYQEVNIVICQLEQQDVITSSGGISFLTWFKTSVLGWDPSIDGGIGGEWSNEEGWQ